MSATATTVKIDVPVPAGVQVPIFMDNHSTTAVDQLALSL